MSALHPPAGSGSLDPRSFHVFTAEGASYLFDRANSATFEINPLLFEVLHLFEQGHDLNSAIATVVPDAEEQTSLWEGLSQLSSSGMFRYTPVDHGRQSELMERLWNHAPRRLQLLMAQGCNLGCRYCYAWRNGSNQKGTLMPLEMATQAVDHLVRNSRSRPELQVTFFGGEPLLNLEVIKQVVAYCRDLESRTSKHFTFELITNGVLLTPEVTDWIVAEKFLLFVSLDGWKEMHNFNRPSMDGDDVYDLILANALYANKRFLEAGLVPMKVRANLTKQHHDWRQVGEYLGSLGFKVIGVGAIEPLNHGDPSPSSMTEDQMDALHQQVRSTLKQVVEKAVAGEKPTYFESVQLRKAMSPLKSGELKGINCGIGRNTQVVDNKGNIFPCHRYEGMDKYIIGHVSTGLDRDQTMAYYQKVNTNATSRCHSCWVRDYCRGGCAWLLSKKDGHLADPSERECERRRSSVELALWIRHQVRQHIPEKLTSEDEVDLNSWTWGAADELNEAAEEQAGQEPSASSCGSGSSCDTCGPSGCGDS